MDRSLLLEGRFAQCLIFEYSSVLLLSSLTSMDLEMYTSRSNSKTVYIALSP